MPNLRPVRQLARDENVEDFDSGEPVLDDWLRKFAYGDQQSGISVTSVLPSDERIVGYYTVAPHSIDHNVYQDIERLGAGQPEHRPIPVILLARLALDRSVQGIGLGGDLLRDALARSLAGARSIGGRAVLVHAKHDKAASFYRRYEFVPLPDSDLHLYLLMKDIRRSLQEGVQAS